MFFKCNTVAQKQGYRGTQLNLLAKLSEIMLSFVFNEISTKFQWNLYQWGGKYFPLRGINFSWSQERKSMKYHTNSIVCQMYGKWLIYHDFLSCNLPRIYPRGGNYFPPHWYRFHLNFVFISLKTKLFFQII